MIKTPAPKATNTVTGRPLKKILKGDLVRCYITQRMTIHETAEELGLAPGTVRKALLRNGVKIRSPGGAHETRNPF